MIANELNIKARKMNLRYKYGLYAPGIGILILGIIFQIMFPGVLTGVVFILLLVAWFLWSLTQRELLYKFSSTDMSGVIAVIFGDWIKEPIFALIMTNNPVPQVFIVDDLTPVATWLKKEGWHQVPAILEQRLRAKSGDQSTEVYEVYPGTAKPIILRSQWFLGDRQTPVTDLEWNPSSVMFGKFELAIVNKLTGTNNFRNLLLLILTLLIIIVFALALFAFLFLR